MEIVVYSSSYLELDLVASHQRHKTSIDSNLSKSFQLTKQKASKEAEKDFRKKEEEVSSFRQVMQTLLP